jgi:hypothetical protein
VAKAVLKLDAAPALPTRPLEVGKFAGSGAAPEPPGSSHVAPGDRPEARLTALFNGRDLTHWRDDGKGHWTVADGILHYDGRGASLRTQKDYGDVELYVDWKIGPGANSGINLRGKSEVQIWDRPEGSGGLYNNKVHPNQPLVRGDRPIGEWNTFHIIIRGDQVTVDLNGQRVVDCVTMENGPEYKEPLPVVGPIKLQHYFGPIQFRNIYLRELGLDAGGMVRRDEARPTSPSFPKVGRQAVEPRLEGVWSRVIDGRTHPNATLLPGGFLEVREGPHRWAFRGRTLVMTWQLPDREVRLTAVVSADGRSYVGTYKNGVKVWGQKLSDYEGQPVDGRAAPGPVKVGQEEARPTSPSPPKVGRQAVEPRLVGAQSRVTAVRRDTKSIIKPDDPSDDDLRGASSLGYLRVGVRQAWLGQNKELSSTCEKLLSLAKNTEDPLLADYASKCCSLRQADPKRCEAALVLARRAVEHGKGSQWLVYFKMALGMAEYRSGHFAEADAAFTAAMSDPGNNNTILSTSAFYRAMCLFRRGKTDLARKLATEAAAKMKPLPVDEQTPQAGGADENDLIMWMAYKETKALLKLDAAPAPLMEMLTTRTWMQQSGGSGPRPIRFLPSGKINQPDGGATWSLNGSSLTMRWPGRNAPGGAWIDRCTLSRDGRSYTGTNQNGLPIRGLISED